MQSVRQIFPQDIFIGRTMGVVVERYGSTALSSRGMFVPFHDVDCVQ
ncbi:Uncharacterised protein [Mycobacterium tuberculosis]|nr:Uncharacterised protein [Mycobacterium tuberculosis]